MGAKGEGHIFKQDGRYYYQIRVNGKKKVKALDATTEADAKKKAAEFKRIAQSRSKVEFATQVAIARKLVREGKLPTKDTWKRYLSNPTRPDSGKGTLSNYERYWKRFASWLERIHPEIAQLAQVSQDIAQEYATELWNYAPPAPKTHRKANKSDGEKQAYVRNGLSPTTYNQQIGALRLIFRVLGPEAGMDENPWQSINKKTASQQCRKDFTREELQRLFDELDKPENDIRDKEEMRLLFHIGAFTGLRLEDAIMLRWEAIDWKNRIISVMPVKTIRVQRRVRIPLHPALEEALSKYGKAKRKGPVLPKMAERYKTNKSGVKRDIQRIIIDAGFTAKNEGVERGIVRSLYGFHSFRHAFASICANSGVPITTLSEILGDNIATLQRYYMHAQTEGRQKVIDALPSSAALLQSVILSDADRKRERISQLLATMDEPMLEKVLGFCAETTSAP